MSSAGKVVEDRETRFSSVWVQHDGYDGRRIGLATHDRCRRYPSRVPVSHALYVRRKTKDDSHVKTGDSDDQDAGVARFILPSIGFRRCSRQVCVCRLHGIRMHFRMQTFSLGAAARHARAPAPSRCFLPQTIPLRPADGLGHLFALGYGSHLRRGWDDDGSTQRTPTGWLRLPAPSLHAGRTHALMAGGTREGALDRFGAHDAGIGDARGAILHGLN